MRPTRPSERMNHPLRTRQTWRLRTRTLELGARTLVMGVVNITPDSFSDGGAFLDPQKPPLRAAMQLLDEGADLLDLGAESTRPGSRAGDAANQPAVSADEEQARLLPVLEGVLRAAPRRNRFRRHLQGRHRARRPRRRRRNHQRRQRLHLGSRHGPASAPKPTPAWS